MAGDDWARYWRADGVPVEAMHAHFTSHVYHRHAHESYSFGVTETGAQAFSCRRGRHISGPGMIMAFNPDDPHDGHAAGRDGRCAAAVPVARAGRSGHGPGGTRAARGPDRAGQRPGTL